jgi:iron complex outermembrane receptor protein
VRREALPALGFGDLGRDRYNVFINASYDHQHPLDQKDRNFSDDSTNRFLLQLGGFAGSSNTFPGNITTGGIGIPGATGTTCPGGPQNVFVPLLGGCFFDPAKEPGVESIPDDKNLNLFLQGKVQLTPNWQAYAHALYGKDENHFIIQGTPISDAITYGPNADQIATITLQPTSPFYPHDLASAAGVDGQPLNVRWRTTPLGHRDTTDTNTGYQVVGGVRGTIADRWDADVSYSYAEGKITEHVNGGFFLFSGLLPVLNSGSFDLFNPTPDMLAQLHQASDFISDVFKGKSSVSAINAKVSGDLFSIRSGTVAGAIGVDLRKEKLEETPVEQFIQGDITGYGGSAGAVHGDRDVKAAFAEVNIPLLRNLELDAAVRTDDYSDFGRTNNPKVSLRFQPSRDLLLRTSYGKGFLAPSLYQLFLPRVAGLSQTGQNDPIRCPVTNDNTLDCNAQFPLNLGGNPDLDPEKSEQFTAGIVFEPNNAFSVSADYFKIRLNNGITNGIPVTTILGDIATYGDLVHRAPPDASGLPGRITAIDQTFINLGATHIEGVDVEAHYKWPRMRYGRLRLDISGTYYSRYDLQNLDGSYSGFIANGFGSPVTGIIPRWKHYASLTWDQGPWSATVANTYQSSYTDWQTDFNGNERTVGSMSLWDLQGTYSGIRHFTFTLGVKNVLDTDPPATNQQNTFQAGYDSSYYDARARFVYGVVRYSFR